MVKKTIFTDESAKGQITDSISENLTDLDLESRKSVRKFRKILSEYPKIFFGIHKRSFQRYNF